MNCRRVRFYLSARCDGGIPGEVRGELEAHIRNCKRCESDEFLMKEILATAKSLPKKHVADDFNLQLMNRIFAEQNNVTESYLPTPEPSLFFRPSAWLSSVATVGALAIFALLFMRREAAYDPMQNDVAANGVSQPIMVSSSVPNAQFASLTKHEMPATAWDYILGVSGEQSQYRSTTIDHMKSFMLASQARAMYEEHLRRMEDLNRVRYKPQNVAMAYPGNLGEYRPYQQPVNKYDRLTGDEPRIRTAHSSWR